MRVELSSTCVTVTLWHWLLYDIHYIQYSTSWWWLYFSFISHLIIYELPKLRVVCECFWFSYHLFDRWFKNTLLCVGSVWELSLFATATSAPIPHATVHSVCEQTQLLRWLHTMSSSMATPSHAGGGGPEGITLNHQNMYKYDASMPDIFGADVKAGRTLLEAIVQTYKAGFIQKYVFSCFNF